MPAYYRATVAQFLQTSDREVSGILATKYAADGFQTQYTAQTTAWDSFLAVLRTELIDVVAHHPDGATWGVLIEFPLYRLRKRIDAVILAPGLAYVVEIKTGATSFVAADCRQAEEYAQDLRDFHAASDGLPLQPVLWCPRAAPEILPSTAAVSTAGGVRAFVRIGGAGLAGLLLSGVANSTNEPRLEEAQIARWDASPYQPIPSVIEAATALFASQNVREITRSDAQNLGATTNAVLAIIDAAKRDSQKILVFITGVPGAGKTLAGLNIAHRSRIAGVERQDTVYLSGNLPLVYVLREALAQDDYARQRRSGRGERLSDTRRRVRTLIQHIDGFLQEYLVKSIPDPVPLEHVIIFDEAQRAWDAAQGQKVFDRDASEPSLILEIMARRPDWCACVCLIGEGQEINAGEDGMPGWTAAVAAASATGWHVYLPSGSLSVAMSSATTNVHQNDDLALTVPMRSFRSPSVSNWIEAVLAGDAPAASRCTPTRYPIAVTRSLDVARRWLREHTRGFRRSGLLASSGARRLRADGLGEFLTAASGDAIAHWYLQPFGDIRSSLALEVPANEYACQGLELDFISLCWGGDLIRSQSVWTSRGLGGNRWNIIRSPTEHKFILNTYRVLLSRAREGLVIWVPQGHVDDPTRLPIEFDDVAAFLVRCGAQPLSIVPEATVRA